MPLLLNSSFPGAPSWQPNGHWQTMLPGTFRRVRGFRYTRERIATPDDDFLDLDWLRNGHQRLVVLTHGLEGDSERQYIRGMAKLFSQHQWDVLAWNCRSCSGEMNRSFRLYHHGDTEDISTVLHHALQPGHYDSAVLIGFSMGGNITLKYLGSLGDQVPDIIRAGVAFSAPCDLRSGAEQIDLPENFMYRERFKRKLAHKIRIKNERFPGRMDPAKLKQITHWRDFDEWFSAPLCGYRDADDFYQQASARNFMGGTKRPTLLVNAVNDPLLTPSCMPVDIAESHPFLYLEQPSGGGHCGFQPPRDFEFYWSERRALAFCHGNMEDCRL